MKQNISWKQALQQKLILKRYPQKAKAIQMQEMASLREEFLNEPIDEKFSALKLEAYYDIIKELIYAYAYKRGFIFSSDTLSDSLLPLYAHHHLHDFKKEIKEIEELFFMKSRIHSLGWKDIKIYLEKNQEMLNRIIEKLKKRLQ